MSVAVGAAGRKATAAHVIDGNYYTLCASRNDPNAWISVRVHDAYSQGVGYVAVYNRNDARAYMSWLSPFEVWVGTSYGDITSASATLCAKVTLTEQQLTPTSSFEPAVVRCDGARGNYVTIRLVGWPRNGGVRYLSIAEVEVFAA